MKSWIFSHNDQLTPALSGDEALKYVTEHPHAYAWNPSYTHWMPITQIAEFAQVVKAPKAPSVIPKELIEQFIVKEKALVEKLNVLDNKIVHAINALSDFESETRFCQNICIVLAIILVPITVSSIILLINTRGDILNESFQFDTNMLICGLMLMWCFGLLIILIIFCIIQTCRGEMHY